MPKFANDTTKTREGDWYQYLIALECCLDAKDGDIVFIEQRGDVATSDTSWEAKHHSAKNHTISDRHEDFWKTLKNWVVNYEVIKDYKKLILLTTSQITKSSHLLKWNECDMVKKLEIISKIKEKKVTKTIKCFVDQIFDFTDFHNESRLLEILDKFFIQHDQPIIQEKIKLLQEREFFKTIAKNKRNDFLHKLLSFINSKAIDDPEKWEINIADFNFYVEYHAKDYTSETRPIPDLFRSKTYDSIQHQDYKFVKEIKTIELDEKISEAVNDYFRTQDTVIHLSSDDPIFPTNFAYYQNNEIFEDLSLVKSNCELDIIDKTDKTQRIRQSKKTYINAMQLPPKKVSGFNESPSFFQRGTIHTIVDSDENDFSWIFEE